MIRGINQNTVSTTVRDLARKGGLANAVPAQYSGAVRYYSQKYRVPENLTRALIHVESRGHINAGSNKGAYGLTQLTDVAVADMKGINKYVPEQNIKGGTQFLAMKLKEFNGDVEKAIVAYNGGPGQVYTAMQRSRKNGLDWRMNIPAAESRNYLAQFRAILNNGNPLS